MRGIKAAPPSGSAQVYCACAKPVGRGGGVFPEETWRSSATSSCMPGPSCSNTRGFHMRM